MSGGSDGKESAHNAGDPGSIPGQGPKILHAALCSQKKISKNNAPQSLPDFRIPFVYSVNHSVVSDTLRPHGL